jgi:hypothetical protein
MVRTKVLENPFDSGPGLYRPLPSKPSERSHERAKRLSARRLIATWIKVFYRRNNSLVTQAHDVQLASYSGRWRVAGSASFNEEFTRLRPG